MNGHRTSSAAPVLLRDVALERALETAAPTHVHGPAPDTALYGAAPLDAPRVREATVTAANGGGWLAEVRLGAAFARQIQWEKRRAERSKAPLSMALYRIGEIDGTAESASDGIDRLLHILRNNKRETDTLGYPEAGLVALLFPDTAAEGARRFVAKIEGLLPGSSRESIVATYPDCLFEDLAKSAGDDAAASPAFDGRAERAKRREYRGKRLLDIVGATVAIVALSPVMIGAAIAVAVSSPGPVLFRQKRLGKGGVPFLFYKFRSMTTGVDDSIHRQYVADLIKGGDSPRSDPADAAAPLYKIKADPRVTRVGRILRKTSIDELPQLFNVLRGDMSLVGPRPALPYEAENYQAWHFRRILEIRPGITGVWQVEGRSRVPFDEMVRMDLRYIRTCSLKLDFDILLRTVKVVLKCDGAT